MKRIALAAVAALVLALYFLYPAAGTNTLPVPESAQRVTLRVDGMTCAACAVSVKMALASLEGVHEAEVDVEGSRTIVLYEPDKVTVDQMVDAINKTGFKAHGPSSG